MGTPLVISQPVRQEASAAVPGSERSSTPVITPKPTPAAKIAVSAAAFATSSALSRVAKYGAHQKENTMMMTPQSTKMPWSRTKTRAETARGMSLPVGTATSAAGAAEGAGLVLADIRQLPAVMTFCGTVSC